MTGSTAAGVWLWMFGVRSEPADGAIAGLSAATSNPGAISPQVLSSLSPGQARGAASVWLGCC